MTGGRSPTEIGTWCGRTASTRGSATAATSPSRRTRPRRRVGGLARGRSRARRRGRVPARSAADEVQERCASPRFGSGVLIHDAATVHPARLARGLRRVLIEHGVRIYERTTVTRLGMGRRRSAETPGGSVRGRRGGGRRSARGRPGGRRSSRGSRVRGSYMVVTAPAPERLEELGWTGGEAIRDLRSSIHYARTTPDGRIALGLGGLQPDLARRIDHRYDYDASLRATRRATTCIGCSRASRACRSRRRGAARSTSAGSRCRSSARSGAATCTTGSATRATASGRRTSAARSSPRSPCTPRTGSRGSRS